MDLDSYNNRNGNLYLFCGYREHDYSLFNRLTKEYNMIMINRPEFLTKELIDLLKPKMLLFPNWSWKVPKEIVDNYTCICYHEGDLPIGRGGSPIQNHIIRGIYDIQSTAYIMNDRIDAGPILAKEPLSLRGTLNEIFQRIEDNNYKLTRRIIEERPQAIPQDDSKAIYYDRRKPKDSELNDINIPLYKLHDFIRMLTDPYPNAFIIIGNKKIAFKSSTYEDPFKISITAEIINLGDSK